MIRVESVAKEYAGGVVAVRDVSFTVPAGETLCLIGSSGCGKTTTLKMINRLVEPTRGTILIDDRSIADIDVIQLRRSIGYVIQKIGLLPHRTVFDNVAILPRLEGWDAYRVTKRVEELLELVGLNPREYGARYPQALSGGQQQRVGVARALALDPNILLMDEPFGALDPISRDQIQEEFLRLKAAFKKTIVLVTHDIAEAFRLGDEVALMEGGSIVQKGAPADFVHAPATPFVETFVKRHARPLIEEVPS